MYLSGATVDRRQQPDIATTSPTTASTSNSDSSPTPSSGAPSSPSISISITTTPTPTQTPTSTATFTSRPSRTPTPAASSSQKSNPSPTLAITIGVLTLVLGITIFLCLFLRRLRIKHKNPKYVPTPFLQRAWENWEPAPSHHRLPDTGDHLEPISDRRTANSPRPSQSSFGGGAGGNGETGSNSRTTAAATASAASNAARVDRNTSVRSVMTLPAYNQNPLQHEQVLAREGERGGIDIVIEFPESGDQEEERRQQEMEALYQVRMARRRENEEREERRTLRREARERGDYVALRELQARARASSAASAGASVEELRAEHERLKTERQRAVSSVSYADLGVARHDGTRIRASSMESEREGLLGDAASIAASSLYHRRDRSVSSVVSIDTTTDLPSPGLTRPRTHSRPDSPLRRVGGASHDEGAGEGRAGSSPEMIDHDEFPPNSPPGYENIPLETSHVEPINEPPPDYSSPVLARGEQQEMFPAAHGSERRASGTISSATRPVSDERRTSRGVGGVPQLPSLRIGNLPSIEIDPGSPRGGRLDEENHHPR
ncbi:Uncharacterized protein BP5553_09883 [Venustampulla echinocandica]|uniref:Uncharacterized protein n=1 Tax=Venustampulla echinocandica TaxID=2656787 RepID=A0A370TAZ2_9HELO|nr:Uncharacterized protein BP5553_09883 [Venustampulla echinocandica]RDL31094.1 Uncharacterized protein BP5553_09883 [Venustampulla echinocandica]